MSKRERSIWTAGILLASPGLYVLLDAVLPTWGAVVLVPLLTAKWILQIWTIRRPS